MSQIRGPQFASIFCGFGLLFLASHPAAAWERIFGPVGSADEGHRRVTPATVCPGGGYLAVGTLQVGAGNPDVYVVRTNNAGGLIWELSFDVQAAAAIDEGIALAEVPGAPPAIVILSNTRVAGAWQPALTQLDCGGALLWSRTYPSSAQFDLRGHDLVRTATPGAGGDLAVAGVASNGLNQDAFLLRTSAAGVPLWSAAYDTGGAGASIHESFNALIEAQLRPGQATADLVAVGGYDDSTGNLQGLMARVNGATGGIGGLPQCMAHHGGGANDTYYSVVQLLTAPQNGQLALTGLTTNGPWVDDVWAVRTGGSPCNIQAQARIGDAGGVPSSEGGFDIREVLRALPGVPVGSLAITGFQGPAALGPYDASLLFLQPGGLAPIQASLFGDHAGQNEVGFSLAQNPAGLPPGFVISGLTRANWEGLGDPQDLYLVNTNAGISTGCSLPWQPTRFQPSWPLTNLVPATWAPAQNVPAFPLIFPMWNPFLVCP